jgi:outer membrane protein
MLKITTRREGSQCTLEVEGKLAGAWVPELEACWQLERSRGGSICVDLHSVTFIDTEGKALLAKLHREGASLAGKGCLTRAIIADVTGEPVSPTDCSHKDFGKKLALIFFVVLFGGRLAEGQEKPPVRLTLHDAVVTALKQNPQTKIVALQAAEAAQTQNLARAQLLPQAQFGVNEERMRENLEALFGRPFPGLPQHIGPFDVFTAGPQFTIPIIDLSLWEAWAASKSDTAAAKDQAQVSREQVALLVTSQYLSALRASADVRASEARVELAQAIFDQASDLQKNGAGTGIDTLRSNVELQNEKQRLIASQTNREVALFGLARLLDIDPHQPVELTDEMSFYETPVFTIDETVEQAWQNRPELHQIESNLHGAEQRKRAAVDERLPTVQASGFWEYQGQTFDNGIPAYQYQAGINVPLFTGGRIHAEIKRAELEVEKAKQQREDLRDQVALEVKTALAQLESARHQVDVANLGVQLAQQEVTQSRDRFAAGVADNVEVVQAQDALARASDNQIEALFEYNQSRANLAHAEGHMESLYAK